MELHDQVVQCLDRGRAFRVAIPLAGLTEFLSHLSQRRPALLTVVIRRMPTDGGDVLIDFLDEKDGEPRRP